jgi:hypothetical protein
MKSLDMKIKYSPSDSESTFDNVVTGLAPLELLFISLPEIRLPRERKIFYYALFSVLHQTGGAIRGKIKTDKSATVANLPR